MMESAGPGEPSPRAFLRVGGITLARHQLAIALGLGCQKIVCVAREVTADLIALQHDAEDAGAKFHVVTGARGLASLVTAHDEVVVLAEGLLADPEEAVALLDGSQAVLVQPVESGVAAGFERIDLNDASAGAMRIPGRLIERLSELPPDCDAPSALTRIALQGGVARREVPAAAREGVRWRLVRSEDEAQAAEAEWIRLHLGARVGYAPTSLLARAGVLAFGPALLHAGAGSKLALLGALAVLGMALLAGWLGTVVLGFVLGAFAWVMLRTAGMLERIEAAASGELPTLPLRAAAGWLLDLVLVLLVVWRSPPMPWETLGGRGFAPVMLVLAIRVVSRQFERVWTAWLEDRALLALLLAAAEWSGVLAGAVQLLAVLVALAGIVLPGRKAQLTRT